MKKSFKGPTLVDASYKADEWIQKLNHKKFEIIDKEICRITNRGVSNGFTCSIEYVSKYRVSNIEHVVINMQKVTTCDFGIYSINHNGYVFSRYHCDGWLKTSSCVINRFIKE